jgi:hypothetical protein
VPHYGRAWGIVVVYGHTNWRTHVMYVTQQAIDACEKAIDRIETYPSSYRYQDYTHCACGHLYRAVEGRYATNTIPITERPPETYAAVITEVATALGWTSDHWQTAAQYVSDRALVKDNAMRQRQWALRLLREAVRELRARQPIVPPLTTTPHDHALGA